MEQGFVTFLSTILPSLISEVKKLLYFLSLGVVIFLLTLIPGLNVFSPILWALYTSWMLATEYAAYPMENHKMYFSRIRSELKSHKSVAFGFGLAVMIMSTIPVVNFFVMPVAVSGATALWVERLKKRITTGKNTVSRLVMKGGHSFCEIKQRYVIIIVASQRFAMMRIKR